MQKVTTACAASLIALAANAPLANAGFDLTFARDPTTSADLGPTDGDPFAKGQWSLEFAGSFTHPVTNGPQQFYGATIGLGYAATDNLMIVGEVSGDYIDDEGKDEIAGGLTLRARYRFLRLGSLSLFVDGSIGAVQASTDVPDLGTHFNFRETIGIGTTVPIGDTIHLIVGAHWEHMSNAKIGDDNPGYNGVEGYVGIVIPL
jgi:hypothetical protein